MEGKSVQEKKGEVQFSSNHSYSIHEYVINKNKTGTKYVFKSSKTIKDKRKEIVTS